MVDVPKAWASVIYSKSNPYIELSSNILGSLCNRNWLLCKPSVVKPI